MTVGEFAQIYLEDYCRHHNRRPDFGVDIYTVKYYLGHKRIETTKRYLHLVPGHAERSVRAAQAREQEELEQLVRISSGRDLGDTGKLDLTGREYWVPATD